jgi:hypothetical protein
MKEKVLRVSLCNEIVISLHHSLESRPEPLAGLGHGILVKAARHLLGLLHQRVGSVVRSLVDM